MVLQGKVVFNFLLPDRLRFGHAAQGGPVNRVWEPSRQLGMWTTNGDEPEQGT